MINKEILWFDTFVGTRVGEIQSETDPADWYWTNSSSNIASSGESHSIFGAAVRSTFLKIDIRAMTCKTGQYYHRYTRKIKNSIIRIQKFRK